MESSFQRGLYASLPHGVITKKLNTVSVHECGGEQKNTFSKKLVSLNDGLSGKIESFGLCAQYHGPVNREMGRLGEWVSLYEVRWPRNRV